MRTQHKTIMGLAAAAAMLTSGAAMAGGLYGYSSAPVMPMHAASATLASGGPSFSTAGRGSGMGLDEMRSHLRVFNQAEVAELLGAKDVSVIHYDAGWNDPGDAQTATAILGDNAQSIHLLREAIAANPAATALLAKNGIAVNQVIDIVANPGNAVALYVS